MKLVFLLLTICNVVKSEVINPHAVGIVASTNVEEGTLERRGGVARLVSDSSDNSADETPQKYYMIVEYTFDNQMVNSAKIPDSSGFDNNGMIDVGGLLLDIDGSSCKVAAYLWDQSIKINFVTPDGVPKEGLTIALWIKFLDLVGQKVIFSAKGRRFGIMLIQFFGKVVRFTYSKCEHCTTHFDLMAETTIGKDWFHFVATFNATTGVAMIFINGSPLNRTVSSRKGRFQYWGNDVHIGSSGGRSIKGFVDTFSMFNYALPSQDIEYLSLGCCFTNCGVNDPPIVPQQRQKLYKRDTIQYREKASDPFIS